MSLWYRVEDKVLDFVRYGETNSHIPHLQINMQLSQKILKSEKQKKKRNFYVSVSSLKLETLCYHAIMLMLYCYPMLWWDFLFGFLNAFLCAHFSLHFCTLAINNSFLFFPCNHLIVKFSKHSFFFSLLSHCHYNFKYIINISFINKFIN